MDSPPAEPDHLALTAQIVAAFVRRNALPASEVPALIERTHKALTRLTVAETVETAAAPVPAVPVKRSVFPDFLICLEDGKKLKMLKRHLATSYNMTPEQYREKWRLPADYPLVAPNYAARRSQLAKKIGLGRRREEPEPEPLPTAPPSAPARGRRRSTPTVPTEA